MTNQKLINKATKLRKELQDSQIRHQIKENIWDNRKKLRSLKYHFVFDLAKDVRDVGIEIAKFNQRNSTTSDSEGKKLNKEKPKKMEIDTDGYAVLEVQETAESQSQTDIPFVDFETDMSQFDLGLTTL